MLGHFTLMPVFQVYLNGKKVSTAGVGELGVLGAHVSWVRRAGQDAALTLHVGGLIAPTKEHVHWIDRKVKSGDEISVRVIDDAAIDRPRSRKHFDPVGDVRSQKRYVRDMAKKFGWKIVKS